MSCRIPGARQPIDASDAVYWSYPEVPALEICIRTTLRLFGGAARDRATHYRSSWGQQTLGHSRDGSLGHLTSKRRWLNRVSSWRLGLTAARAEWNVRY